MNIPFERPEQLLVESLLNRQRQIEQAQAQLNADVADTYRFLEKVHDLEQGAIGSKFLLTLDGLIEQKESPPPPDEFESSSDATIPDSPSVS